MASLPMVPSADLHGVGASDYMHYGAQWLARVCPYRRFAGTLTSATARLGVGVACWAFPVWLFHPRLHPSL